MIGHRLASAAWLLLLGVSPLAAQTTGAAPAEAQEKEERPTGLPPGIEWTFNLAAGFGSFSFLNSLFTNPRDEPSGDLSDNWLEGYVEPSLSGVLHLGGGSAIYGTASAAGTRTYGGAPSLVGEDFASFAPDDLFIGWRSGSSLALGEDAIDLRVGRSPYELGQGFLVYDGNGEGGSRGAYWSNARTAFGLAAIARLAAGGHTVETFYLDKDELPEAESKSRLWGANYEWRPAPASTFGVTYMKCFADPAVEPGRDGLGVFNLRAYTAPLPALPALAFEFEYAREDNRQVLTSNAWTLRAAYELTGAPWTPTVSYRYAFFQGDAPETTVNEGFDPLFLGFSDWGTWWQGEIAGEYFLSNSNLKSHQIRVHAAPSDRLETGVIVYRFLADRPASYGEGVTASDLAVEVDVYAEWELNRNFSVSLVGGFANPGEAVSQATGRTANFSLALLSVAYRY